MNMILKKITAGLLAVCCVPAAGLTAAAADLDYVWGVATWDAFEDMELIGEGTLPPYKRKNSQLYLRKGGYGDCILVTPRHNFLRFVLREDLEQTAAEEMAFAIVDAHLPGEIKEYYHEGEYADFRHWANLRDEAGKVLEGVNQTAEHSPVYDVYFNTAPAERGAQWEAEILLDLARNHLISEYYGFGETAEYHTGFLENGILQYQATMQVMNDQTGTYEEVPIDWAPVQAYLDEHHPGVIKSEPYTVTYRDQDGTEELIRIGAELWEQFGLWPLDLCFLDTESPVLFGHNSLERKGDVTLDCELSIVDVIALNRNLMVNDPLCDTAKKNADIDGSGMPDEADSLAILKEVVEITKDFQET